MSTLVSPERMEELAWDHPCSTIQSEYDGELEIRRHLMVSGTHYVANVVRREVTLAEAMRAVRP